MSEQNTESTYPKGPAVRNGEAARLDSTEERKNFPGTKLDKTLSHVEVGLPKGPDQTPGGHGQVWREK